MKFLQAIEAIAAGFARYVARNPLWVLFLVVILVGAPGLAKGITLFILYACLSVFLLFTFVALWFGYKVRKAQREMGRSFEQQGFWGYRTQGGTGSSSRPDRSQEGEVRLHRTGSGPEKRISDDVGDYVDFEETKNR